MFVCGYSEGNIEECEPEWTYGLMPLLCFLSVSSQVSVKQPTCDNPINTITSHPISSTLRVTVKDSHLIPQAALLRWGRLVSGFNPDVWHCVPLQPEKRLLSWIPSLHSKFSSFVLSIFLLPHAQLSSLPLLLLTLSFHTSVPMPCNLQSCHTCVVWVSDTLARVAILFPLMLHGWLKPYLGSDPYLWQHYPDTYLFWYFFHRWMWMTWHVVGICTLNGCFLQQLDSIERLSQGGNYACNSFF